jgi:HTH-type transcriptional regulator / antitoxin HipB
MFLRSVADFAAAIRGARLDRGLSQADLARLSGVSRKWISEFETGKSTVELSPVMRVLEALDLDMSLSPTPGGPREADLDHLDLDALLEEYRTGE